MIGTSSQQSESGYREPLVSSTDGGESWRIYLPPALLVVLFASVAAQLREVWLDEAYTLAATNNLWTALRAAHGSMGAYYGFIWVWGQWSDSALWLRVPSILAMAGAVALFTKLVARLHGPRVAKWTGLCLAVSFPVLRFAAEARSYALVCLLVVGAWYALEQGVSNPDSTSAWRWHRLCCLVLPLLHGVAGLQIVLQAGALLISGVRGRTLRRASVGFFLAFAVTAIMWAVGAAHSADWLPGLTLSSSLWLILMSTVPTKALWDLAAAATPARYHDRTKIAVPPARWDSPLPSRNVARLGAIRDFCDSRNQHL